MVLHDQHVHSSFSGDSKANLNEYYQIAKNLGCSYFVTTEHLDYDITMLKCDWIVDVKALKAELNQIEVQDGPKTLLGIEVGYRRDYLEQIKQILNSEKFDLINLSIHDSGQIEYYFVDGFKQIGIKETMQIYYQQMLDAVNNFDCFDVLSHLDYGFKTAYKIDPTYDFFSDGEVIKQILTIIIKKGKALEINTKVQKDLPNSHLLNFLKLYQLLGGTRLTLSSDAHQTCRYLDGFEKYKAIIKQAGFKFLCYFVARKEYHFDI